MAGASRVVAVLGPTNTGKTHYAIERMLAHRTGVIGLPLRLLAREVYDRILALRGPSVVALVTGEERIVPDRTQYWVCTVEAMPVGIGADFLAVDEIQLCADPERGHVFTERLLGARGLHETLFLGSDTMRGAIAALVPGAIFQRRERLSTLSWAGSKKISRLPPRSAIVSFSVENVYAIAELIRRQKGGCAVVMGALSPRTRNAQVALYQNGEVDYLVATDAIGMGLNLDIAHVAFAATAKFDGRRMRALWADELAQIAGRAGRHLAAGSFGVTGEARALPEETIAAIESHSFTPLRKLQWRNPRLEFGSVARLIAGLEERTDNPWLTRVREADDVGALKTLADIPEVRARIRDARDVKLLWEVCRIPDFRSISATEHAGLLGRIHEFLHDGGTIPADWLARNIARIDRTDGDIDALSRRLAYIRTWTYVAQRPGWVDDEHHWRGATRAVEDRLSDALHARLTQRFVDRRTSVLLRRLNQRESLVAEVNDKGEVSVEGQHVGRLEGFRFRQDGSASPEEARTLRQAAVAGLAPHFHLRSDRFYNAPDTELDLTEQGGLMWGNDAVGRLEPGPEPMRPQVVAFVDEEAGPEIAEKVRRRLQHFVDRRIAALFEPLMALQRDEALTGLARGFAFRLVEALGIIAREGVAEEVRALDQEARGALRRHGVRFGQYTIFLPALLKPAPTRLRLVLWSLAQRLDEFPESPPPGLVTIPHLPAIPSEHYLLAGYRPSGARAIRIDMLERLADLLRSRDARAGFEAAPEMLSITGLTAVQFADLMQGLGYAVRVEERVKQRPASTPEAAAAVEQSEPEAAAAAFPEAGAPPAASEVVAPEEAAGSEAMATAADDASPEPEPEPASAPEVQEVAEASAEAAAGGGGEAEEAPAPTVETETVHVFTWAPRRRDRGDRGTGDRERSGPRRRGKGPRQGEGAGASADTSPVAPPGAGAEAGTPPPQGGRPRNRDRGPAADGDRSRGGDQNRDQNRGPKGGKPGRAPGGKDSRPHGSKGGKGAPPPRREDKPRVYASSPARSEGVDPDSPFAVLAALRDRR